MIVAKELLSYRQWIVWRQMEVNGRPTKVPLSVSGKKALVTEPNTWASYRDAERAVKRLNADGIGFVFTVTDPFCGVDIDSCIENKQITASARRVLNQLHSFAELSPSKTGVHIIVRAKLAAGRHPKGIGMFDRARYFTMTGLHLKAAPYTIEHRQAEIDALYAELFPAPERKSRPVFASRRSDEQVLDKAMNARNGDRFRRVWRGGLDDFGGDWSAADIYLVTRLLYWADGDTTQVDRLFRLSGLMRDKWDSRRGPSGTYGELTIAAALEKRR